MEWSTIWTAIGAVATVLGVVGIGFALNQLRFDAWVKAQEIFTNDEFVKVRTSVFAHFDDPLQPWPDPKSEDAKKMCRKMDELAHLLPFIGRKRMFLVWSHTIAKAWLLLEPTVNTDRRTSHWEEKWIAFADLGAKAVEIHPKVKKLRDEVLAQQSTSQDAKQRAPVSF